MGRNIARDVAGLVLAILGGLALIALTTLLISRHDLLAVGLLGVGGVFGVSGYRLGHYDPAARARPEVASDGIEMVPRVRGDSPPP